MSHPEWGGCLPTRAVLTSRSWSSSGRLAQGSQQPWRLCPPTARLCKQLHVQCCRLPHCHYSGWFPDAALIRGPPPCGDTAQAAPSLGAPRAQLKGSPCGRWPWLDCYSEAPGVAATTRCLCSPSCGRACAVSGTCGSGRWPAVSGTCGSGHWLAVPLRASDFLSSYLGFELPWNNCTHLGVCGITWGSRHVHLLGASLCLQTSVLCQMSERSLQAPSSCPGVWGLSGLSPPLESTQMHVRG